VTIGWEPLHSLGGWAHSSRELHGATWDAGTSCAIAGTPPVGLLVVDFASGLHLTDRVMVLTSEMQRPAGGRAS
jgi:hypothetical protein